jgi:DNA ligase (NAD+)
MEARIDKLQEVKGIGIEIAQSICDFFSNEQNRVIIRKLLSRGIMISSPPKEEHKGTIFTGKNICFTGALSSMTRSDAKVHAEILGAHVVDSVSRRLDFLVAGKDPGSKFDKATMLGIRILSEDEFLTVLKETS